MSRQRERDVVEAAATHALTVDQEGIGLTRYGIATCAAALAIVLMDPAHPNHEMACERHGLEPRTEGL